MRRILLLLIGLLYLVSVPWYREGGSRPEIVFGLPDWVAVAIGCYALAAVLNAVAWLLTDVPETPEAADVEEASDALPGPGSSPSQSGEGNP